MLMKYLKSSVSVTFNLNHNIEFTCSLFLLALSLTSPLFFLAYTKHLLIHHLFQS